MSKTKKKKLILIDSNAIIHRAFHALPPLKTKDGTPSGAVYGFALTLLAVLEKEKPDYIMAAFDMKGPTFRHEKFEDYKAKRVKAPDELYEQIPVVKEMLESFGVPIFEQKGFEADDIIGTVAKNKNLNGEIERVIVTGDADSFQLVDDDIKIFMLQKGIKDTAIIDERGVKKKFGLRPDQIIDYKSLRGDPSDNIPGVKGIGDKGAVNLLSEYETLEGVYENIEKIKPDGLKKKLEDDRENAFLSQELATIVTDMELDFGLEKCRKDNLDNESLAAFFRKMGFRSLFNRISEDGEEFDEGKKFEKKEIEIKMIESEDEVEKLITKIKKEKKFSCATLASGKSLFESKLLGIGISIEEWKAVFVPEKNVEKFQNIFEDDKILKIGFGVKGDLELLWKQFCGEDLYNDEIAKYQNFFDCQIAAYLLGFGQVNDFEKLILKEFDAELAHGEKKKGGQGNLLGGMDEEKEKCTAEKAVWISKMHKEFERILKKMSKEQKREGKVKKDVLWLMEKLETPLGAILAKMELFGVKVEKEKLDNISKKAEKDIAELEAEIHKLTGEEFNINSPSQLAPILYEKLKVPTTGIKRGKANFSTDADQLRKVRDFHPIISLIEKYREFFKLKTTYTDALPKLIEEDGRIHAQFNQPVAATGRLSSSEPNLQNIPKRGKWAGLIREAFVAEKGKILVSADYSQIDLRVAAHLSGDKKMVQAFKDEKDIHRATAAWVNGLKEEEVSKKQRSEAKSLNFGILYGMGIYGFMRDSGLSRESAETFIDGYKKAFSGLTDFIEEIKEGARENEFVETELGRRRYIQNINASNAMLKNAAERVAVNLPIQGLSADIMKLAMVEVEEKILAKYNSSSVEAKMILQIHDEMIFEVNEKIADKFSKELKKVMEEAYQLKVPLVVDVSKGKNWEEL